MASQIAQQYEDNSIYVVLYLRGANPGFHWGIYVPTATPVGYKFHVTDMSGGWKFEQLSETVPTSGSLVLAFKVGQVMDWARFQGAMASIPADGTASRVTGQPFSCRTWVLDVLNGLHVAGIIVLPTPIEQIEQWAVDQAERHREPIEMGMSSALVYSKTGYNTN